MKPLLLLIILFLLSGCQIMQDNLSGQSFIGNSTTLYLCETDHSIQTFDEFCQLDAWSEYLINSDILAWPERNKTIKNLGNESKQTLQRVLLSQGIDTPYVNRLRAQNWLVELKPKMDPNMREVLRLLIEEPSQQMLELESAISILTKVNARQERSIAELQEMLSTRSKEIQKQREQVEQLLQIEASMSGEKRSNEY